MIVVVAAAAAAAEQKTICFALDLALRRLSTYWTRPDVTTGMSPAGEAKLCKGPHEFSADRDRRGQQSEPYYSSSPAHTFSKTVHYRLIRNWHSQ
jgi:hypothetical protein